MDIHNLSELITALQAETEHDAITPYSLGSLLRVIAALLGDAGSENSISTLQSQLNAERSARMTADTAMATDISQLSTSLSDERRARIAADAELLSKIVHKSHILELGSLPFIESAFVITAEKDICTNVDISLIHFTFEEGKQSGTILQQVGSMVSNNICTTTQIFTYMGYFAYRTISFYYTDDAQGHHAKDIIVVGRWNHFLGSVLEYDARSGLLMLKDVSGADLSDVRLPVVPDNIITSVEIGSDFKLSVTSVSGGQEDEECFELQEATPTNKGLLSAADKQKLNAMPTLQTAWDTGTTVSYVYSKKWVSGADNSRSVLAAGTTLGQQGGKLKMRYVFWGGGGGKVYENIIPTATTTADGVMSAADKAALEDLKNRVAALEAR